MFPSSGSSTSSLPFRHPTSSTNNTATSVPASSSSGAPVVSSPSSSSGPSSTKQKVKKEKKDLTLSLFFPPRSSRHSDITVFYPSVLIFQSYRYRPHSRASRRTLRDGRQSLAVQEVPAAGEFPGSGRGRDHRREHSSDERGAVRAKSESSGWIYKGIITFS